MVFVGCGFTSGGQELVCSFGAAVCKVQTRETASLKVKGPLYRCMSLDSMFALQKYDT